MSTLAKGLRARRAAARNRRAIAKAIRNAGSPTMHDELCLVAQRNGL